MAIETGPPADNALLGLLPYEAIFAQGALAVARVRQKAAGLAVGEAAQNSGGDWALDDPTTQAAVQEAGREDDAVRKLTALVTIASTIGVLEYPDEHDAIVRPGSRVQVKTASWSQNCDVVTRKIPGLPHDEEQDISVVSAQSVMGRAILGKAAGDIATWIGAGGHEFNGTIASIDQLAQKRFYERLFEGYVFVPEKPQAYTPPQLPKVYF